MALREVIVFPDERLRRKSEEVKDIDDELRVLIADMFDTMYADDGIGLAAPQVGVHKRLVVMDVVLDEETGEHLKLVLINPVITERQGEVTSTEGCLSVPEYRAEVKRAEIIKIEALDENGQKQTLEANGLLAICIQHELDHLDGKLFIDYLSRLKRERLLVKYKKLKHKKP